jgi:hypothetical protein
MADDVLFALYPYIVWAPFFERGKFRYWAPTGRGRIKIGKDGNSRVELYSHAHISGGSIWLRLLPPGEEPEDQPVDDAQEQPKRPSPRAQDHGADEDEDY